MDKANLKLKQYLKTHFFRIIFSYYRFTYRIDWQTRRNILNFVIRKVLKLKSSYAFIVSIFSLLYKKFILPLRYMYIKICIYLLLMYFKAYFKKNMYIYSYQRTYNIFLNSNILEYIKLLSKEMS